MRGFALLTIPIGRHLALVVTNRGRIYVRLRVR